MGKRIDQVLHLKSIFGYVGLLLHVPGCMALGAIIVALFFEELFALVPLLVTAALSFSLGQLLYRLWFDARHCHLWDAMLIAALAWFLCPVIGIVPYIWIAQKSVAHGFPESIMSVFFNGWNALFESFSGFTTTGFSLFEYPNQAPATLIWWRTLSSWVGGGGLILFLTSITQPSRMEYRLYHAEARSENVGTNVTHSAQIIWSIYGGYTLAGAAAFYFAGMSLWEAINHAMTAISTGGFTLTSDSFQSYGAAIKIIAIVLMLFGSMSFALQYEIVRNKQWTQFFVNPQQATFLCLLVGGGGLALFVAFMSGGSAPSLGGLFDWISALTTTGFNASHIASYVPPLQVLLLLGMLIGGCSGSSSGGIKVIRFRLLLKGIYVRIKSITDERERFILGKGDYKKGAEPGEGMPMSASAQKLYAAGILLTAWMGTLFLAWFSLLCIAPELDPLACLFEVFSAMGNVGLSSDIMGPDFSSYGKVVYMILMWMGRLEIVPVLILISSVVLQFRIAPKVSHKKS